MDLSWLSTPWQLLVARGAVAAVFGVVAVAWPVETVTVLVVLWGVWASVDGLTWLAQAVRGARGPGMLIFGGVGVLALAVGLVAILRPSLAASAVTWVLGAWLLVRACVQLLLASVKAPPASRGLLVLSGLVDGALGLLFITNPGEAAVGVASLLGVLAIVWGVALVALGLAARHAAGHVPGEREGDPVGPRSTLPG